MLKIKKGSIVSKAISIMLTFLMCMSSCSMLVFADEPVKYGGWTVTNNGTSSGVAVFDGMDLTYYSPSSKINSANSTMSFDGVEYAAISSNGSNGAVSNGIVTIDNSTRGYIKYVPTEDGTFTTWIENKAAKTFYVSKTNNKTNEATAVGNFVAGSGNAPTVTNAGEMNIVEKGNNCTAVSIEVKAGYTYYYCHKGTKLSCFGGKFEPYTKVSGKIDCDDDISDIGIKFTNSETKAVFEATVDEGKKTYSVALKAGYTYSVGVTDSAVDYYAISEDSGSVEVSKESEQDFDIKVEKLKSASVDFTVSGSISGIASGYNTEDFGLTFVPEGSEEVAVEAEINKTNMTYSAVLLQRREYRLVQSGALDYELAENVTVVNNDEKPVSKDIAFKDVATFDVSGKLIGLGSERGVYEDLTSGSPIEIKFTNSTDNYSYSVTSEAGRYSLKLRKGNYIATVTSSDYSATAYVAVDNSAVSKNILLKYEGESDVPFAETIYVGDDKDYKTVSAAVSAVSNMTRENNERVTIKVDPGEYREQVYIDVPNITLESNGGNKDNTKITWYYGIGYKYYSVVDSVYNPYAEYEKYEKGVVDKFSGATVVTTAKATGFNAKNICFENSFNKYMTDEEISDGVEFGGDESLKVVRKETTDVKSKNATGSAAAYANFADKTEFFDCSFVGVQNTLYTCDTNFKAYYKNCHIEGMIDYISGNGDVIFDGCELNWCGYSDVAEDGYITAQSASSDCDTEFGYVFRNCFVSANNDCEVGKGSFGRMLGKCATVNFINTQLQSEEMINSEGWTAFGENLPTMETVKLLEFNTTFNGEKVDTSKRAVGAVETIDSDKYSVKNIFVDKGWTPNYYVEESSATPEIIEGPAFTSNGDINAPNPGETLTVNYKLTDGCLDSNTSRIAWYAVSTNFDNTSLETILKSATLLDVTISYISNDKYQIPMECAGKYIMVVVTPITVGGKQGTAKYEIAETKAVGDTWINPDNQGELAPGEGINIFLAGDSTVKDYSAKGMYQGGKINALGSWGEFFQKFFNEDAVTINNYANGGRSLRSFLNDGYFDKIINNISEGDFLLIQFGHDDCANGEKYCNDRFVPLYAEPNGTDVVDGIYPTVLPTEGMKGTDGKFAWDCGATYKGYMQYYIDEAIKKGAVPVIVSPVARMYYTEEGKIRNSHDALSTDYAPTAAYTTSGNAYVTACEQLYRENLAKGNTIYYIDAFDLTKTMFEDAWKACGDDSNGSAMMRDSAHCNKVGGVIEAGLIAESIKRLNISVSEYIVQPTTVYGETASGEYIFTVKNKEFTAFNNDLVKNDYVTAYGQKILNTISETFYSVSGKTNLTSGTMKIVDENGEEVATAGIKADGSYSFNVSLVSIENEALTARVEGYDDVVLKLTVSEDDKKVVTADDVTFEEIIYSVSGKTNLTSGTMKIVDENGEEVATAEIKADGSYNFNINFMPSIEDKVFGAKIDGYDDVVLKLTVSKEDKKVVMADDVTFEEIIYSVSGRTNLTSGTIKVVDKNGEEVATAEIKADGSYSFVVKRLPLSVEDDAYTAKVVGFKSVGIKFTVDETNARVFVANDVTFEKPTIASGVVGDVDNDGEISVNDASLVLKKVLEAETVLPVEVAEDYMQYADVSKDDLLTALDSAMILKKALDVSFEF